MMKLFFKYKMILNFLLTVIFFLPSFQSLKAYHCTNDKFNLDELARNLYDQDKGNSEIELWKFSTNEFKADTITNPKTISPQRNGNLHLTAEKGRAFGSNIKYMPKWEAFGWFNADDRVEWNVKIAKTGSYEVYLEWSVSNEEAGKPFLFEVGNKKIRGEIEKTGSWQSFRTEKIGQLHLPSGHHKMIFQPASEFDGGALLDLKEVWLIPIE